jgi:hypothetical protein
VTLKNTSTAIGAPGGVEFVLSGRVELAARTTEGGTQLALRVLNARFESEGQSVDQYAALGQDLAQTYVLTLHDGVTVGEALPPRISTFAASILRSLGNALQLGPGTPSADGSWKTEELDGTGKYRVQYRALPAADPHIIERKKLSYWPTPVPNANPLLGKQTLEPQVVSSTGTLRLGRQGTLEQISTTEEIALAIIKGVVNGRTELQLVKEVEVSAWKPDWQATLAVALPATPGAPFGQGPAPEVIDAQRIGDYTFDSALKELRQEAQAQELARQNKLARSGSELNTRAFSAMIGLLRLRPEARERAAALVAKREPVSGTLADALSSAGTPECQAVLVGLLSAAEPTKQQVASSLVRVEAPTQASESAVRGLCADERYLEYCLFGLGSYARKLRDGGNGARAAQLGKFLVERFGTAKPGVERLLVLRGIANSGDVQAFPFVSPLLNDSTASLRAAAVDAIRLMPGAEVERALIERLGKDTSTGVRLSVISAAAARPQSEALRAAVVHAALNDTNSGVRNQAVRVMAKWLPEVPSLHEPLSKVAQSDANDSVKSAAIAALAP